MLYQAVHAPESFGHMMGDVWILAGGISLASPFWRLKKYQD